MKVFICVAQSGESETGSGLCDHLRKLLLGDSAGLVALVGLGYHQFQLVVGHSLPKLPRNGLEVLESDEFFIIEGEKLECTNDFLL